MADGGSVQGLKFLDDWCFLKGILMKCKDVPEFHEGVPFKDVFRTLAEIGFWGPMVVEMWAHMQPGGNALEPAIQGRKLVDQLISSAWKL